MTTGTTARHIDAAEIPVIDMAPLVGGGDPRAVAERIHRAVTQTGFFYVANHPVPQAVIDAARAAAVAFFALPMEDKERVAMTRHHRGFLCQGGARMPDAARADDKESFVWGADPAPGDPRIGADDSFLADNLWPAEPAGLRSAANAFFEHAQHCAALLMRAFAIALDVPANAFLKTSDDPISRASLVYYPPQAPSPGETRFGVGPHTDFGCLTVLSQDDVGGLEVLDAGGDWVTAHPIPGTLVVNVGDLLARWSNDRFRSTPHRVINGSGRPRYSLVLAFDPDAATVIDPADFLPAGETPRYPATTCGAYIAERFDKSFSYRQ